jgi:hypothetical protein
LSSGAFASATAFGFAPSSAVRLKVGIVSDTHIQDEGRGRDGDVPSRDIGAQGSHILPCQWPAALPCPWQVRDVPRRNRNPHLNALLVNRVSGAAIAASFVLASRAWLGRSDA